MSPASRASPSAAAPAARSSPTRSRASPTSTRATRRSRSSPAPRRRTSPAGRRGWAGSRSPGTRSPTTSTATSASTSGTARTRSSVRATRSSAPTSSTPVATRRWAAPGRTSTSPRSGARRSGRTRPPATRRRRRTSGGTTTTRTTRRRRPHDPRARRRRAGGGAPPVGHRASGRARVDDVPRATPPEPRRVTETGHTLRIERTYRAAAHAVFDAFTSPEVMRRWWHAERDWETSEAEVDLRVGGEVRVVMRDPQKEAEYGGGGRYTAVDPPRRLAFTGLWDDEPRRTLIEIEFEETGGVTTVRFTHTGLWDEEAVRSHEGGWNRCFDNLERTLTSPA